jgi:hypothetical protein
MPGENAQTGSFDPRAPCTTKAGEFLFRKCAVERIGHSLSIVNGDEG